MGYSFFKNNTQFDIRYHWLEENAKPTGKSKDGRFEGTTPCRQGSAYEKRGRLTRRPVCRSFGRERALRTRMEFRWDQQDLHCLSPEGLHP